MVEVVIVVIQSKSTSSQELPVSTWANRGSKVGCVSQWILEKYQHNRSGEIGSDSELLNY